MPDALSTAEVDLGWNAVTPWDDQAWRRQALAWIQDQAGRLGRPIAPDGWRVRVRPWSVIFRIPAAGAAAVAGPDEVLWFKANPPSSAHEPALLAALGALRPDRVVVPLAVDPALGWSLQPHGGVVFRAFLDSHPAASPAHWEAALAQYGRFQRDLVPYADDFAALGVPRCPTADLPDLLSALIDAAVTPTAADRAELRRRLSAYAARCAELAALGPFDALDHADLHDNQILGPDRAGGHRFFDWGDAIIGHPFASLRVALETIPDRYPDADPNRLRDAYLEPWTDTGLSAAELRRAATLACEVGGIGRVLAWSRVFDEHRAGGDLTLEQELAESLWTTLRTFG